MGWIASEVTLLSGQPKMSFNAAAIRIRCELSRQSCLTSESPPADLIQRAKAKMEQVKTSGEAAFYMVFESRLNEVWKALRNANDLPPEHVTHITLVAGAPQLPGLKVVKAPNDKAIAAVSIEANKETVANWRWEWFKLTVMRSLREAGVRDAPNMAQLFGAFQRARTGEKVVNVAINSANLVGSAAQPGKSYAVVANKQRQEIGVVIRSMKELRDKAARDQMAQLVAQAIKQLSTDGIEYVPLKKDFHAALQSCLDGPEFLDLELPLVILAALGRAKAAATAPVAPPPTNYKGAGRITFTVSPDKMEAIINGFRMEYYNDKSFNVTIEWLQMELKRCLVSQPMPDDIVKLLSDAIAKQEDLNGRLACRGDPGEGARAPFLHPAYKDASSRSTGNLDEDRLDIREMQQRDTVKSGQLVAEIRYKKPARPGRNVYGEELTPPDSDSLVIRAGDGIVQREGQKFYATNDGIPVIEGESIALTQTLIHKGDVNLRSGNIRFDGSVEIHGSVDSGAVVDVSGDLKILGSVRGGFIRSRGSITIQEGVTTGPTGRVQCRNDIKAEFIENSNIVCGGTLRVGKALINSQVYAGGNIEMSDKEGTIAGGRLFCRDVVLASNLGFKRGAITIVNVGADWRVARTLDIRKTRLEKLQERLQQDRQALRELVQRSKTQLTPRHKEMKDELQERLTRLRTICEGLESKLGALNAQMTYNADARILVREQLASNVSLTVGGQAVAVINDLAAVAVLAKRRRGSFIMPIEEFAKENQGGGGTEEAQGKKAG